MRGGRSVAGQDPQRALVGHTAWADHARRGALFEAKAINRRGRVEDGNTVCDVDPRSRPTARPSRCALAPFTWKATKVNLIDTRLRRLRGRRGRRPAGGRPGGLRGERGRGRRGADRGHLEAGRRARRATDDLRQQARPRAGVVPRVLEQLRDRFRLPASPPSSCHRRGGRVPAAWPTCSPTPRSPTTAAPPCRARSPTRWKRRSTRSTTTSSEGIVVADDELLEGYLEGRIPSFERWSTPRPRWPAPRSSPVVCGSAPADVAIDRLADFICEIGPAPGPSPVVVTAGDGTAEVAPDPRRPPARVRVQDHRRPLRGAHLAAEGAVRHHPPGRPPLQPRTHTDERLHSLLSLRGRGAGTGRQERSSPATSCGRQAERHRDQRHPGPKGLPVGVAPSSSRPPVLSIAITAKTQADEDKVAGALTASPRRDPPSWWSATTTPGPAAGRRRTHLTVTIRRLKRKFGVEVETEPVKVAYRETITAGSPRPRASTKKQSGAGANGVASVHRAPRSAAASSWTPS